MFPTISPLLPVRHVEPAPPTGPVNTTEQADPVPDEVWSFEQHAAAVEYASWFRSFG